jgi:hypothetical protein
MGCGLETCIDQKKKCLTSSKVEEVFAAVNPALAEPSSQLPVLSSESPVTSHFSVDQ